MKKQLLILLALILLIAVFTGCDCNPCRRAASGSTVIYDGEDYVEVPYITLVDHAKHVPTYIEPIRVLYIDTCEYVIISDENGRRTPTHKGNCIYCKERNKKLMKEAIREVMEEEGIKISPTIY